MRILLTPIDSPSLYMPLHSSPGHWLLLLLLCSRRFQTRQSIAGVGWKSGLVGYCCAAGVSRARSEAENRQHCRCITEKEKIPNFPSPVKRPRSGTGTSYSDISKDGFSDLCPCCLTLALVIWPKRLILFFKLFFLADFLPTPWSLVSSLPLFGYWT